MKREMSQSTTDGNGNPRPFYLAVVPQRTHRAVHDRARDGMDDIGGGRARQRRDKEG